MALQHSVEVNRDQLAEAISLFEFVGGQTTDAIRIAINKTAPKVRTRASSEIRGQVRLTAGYVRDRLEIRRASRATLVGSVRTPSRGLLLSRFSTDAQIANDSVSWIKPPDIPAGGIRVKVKPSGSTKILDGDGGRYNKPFYIVLRNSRALGIAARRPYAGPSGGTIDVFHGPSLSQVFDTVRDQILPAASDEYQAQLLDAMRYILAKKFPPEEAAE